MENEVIDTIGKELKELLKTDNDWIPQYNNLILPPFIMGKAKHNNITGVNKFGSGITTFTSYGRMKRRPIAYFCDFNCYEDGFAISCKLRDFGINAPLCTDYTNSKIKIILSFVEANKFLNKNPKK